MTLIISPHSDDALLGAFSFTGRATILICSLNESACPMDPKHRINKVNKYRETHNAYGNFIHFETPVVNKFYEVKYELVKLIEEVINDVQPDTILIPYPSFNQDHQVVYDACMVALRPHDNNHYVPRVLMYDVYDYTNWGENQMTMNYFREVDIKEKLKAYRKMRSQVRSYRSPTDLKRWAETVGKKCNMKYAEGFQCLRYS